MSNQCPYCLCPSDTASGPCTKCVEEAEARRAQRPGFMRGVEKQEKDQ